MEKRKLTTEQRESLRNLAGYTDEQINRIENDQKRHDIVDHGEKLWSIKMIAECIEAENCSFNKVGDKYVFGGPGYLIKNESCKTPCLWAMHSFLPFSFMLYDRVASGLDPNGMHYDHVQCEDTAVHHGGFGKATFKIRFESTG
jgi:uncharacterized repeat protein (TIGR04076 family)